MLPELEEVVDDSHVVGIFYSAPIFLFPSVFSDAWTYHSYRIFVVDLLNKTLEGMKALDQ